MEVYICCGERANANRDRSIQTISAKSHIRHGPKESIVHKIVTGGGPEIRHGQ